MHVAGIVNFSKYFPTGFHENFVKDKAHFFLQNFPGITTINTSTKPERAKCSRVFFVEFGWDFDSDTTYLSGDLAELGEAAEPSAFFFLEPRLLFNLLKESLSDFARVRFR